jgi:hypothetical protein
MNIKASEICKIGNNSYGKYLYSIRVKLSTLVFMVILLQHEGHSRESLVGLVCSYIGVKDIFAKCLRSSFKL